MTAEGKAGDCRFIALGIRTMQEELQTAYRAGFHDTLMKPFDQTAIVQVVRRNLPNQELMNEIVEGILRLNLGPFLGGAGSGRSFSGQAQKMVLAAVADAADEGHSHVVLDLLEADDSADGRTVAMAVHKIRRHAETLGIRVSVVCDVSQQHRGLLANGDQTFEANVFRSVEEVVGQFAPGSMSNHFAVA